MGLPAAAASVRYRGSLLRLVIAYGPVVFGSDL